jgi:hypothetical protein
MNNLVVVAIIVMTAWLVILSVLLLLSIRQIGILTVRLSMDGERFSLDKDGPEIGSNLPAEVIKIVPEVESLDANFMLLSASCNPCRDLAANLGEYTFPAKIIVLLAGREELAEGLVSMLPSDFQIVRDPEATQVAAAFHIESTPFGVGITNGKVIQKAYLHSKDDLFALVNRQKTLQPNHNKE